MHINSFAIVALYGWIPVTFLIFCVNPPRRAATISVIAGYLFLPQLSFYIAGLPDFSKATVISIGTLLCVAIFDGPRLFSVRPRWFDAPIVCYCVVAMIMTRLTNGIPIYEGLSLALDQTTYFGIPYLIGRVYYSDAEGVRDLAIGFVIGGLVYVPLCLWEMRMSPRLNSDVYGFTLMGGGFAVDNVRWGGFRPTVFLQNGLTLSMWMSATAVAAYCLWSTGTVKRLFGLNFGGLTALLVMTSVFCRSTGAVALLALGIGLWFSLKGRRAPAFVLIFLLLPLAYMTARTTRLWSGSAMVEISRVLSEDRAASLKFRIDQENELINKAMQRPIFGWAGWRSRVTDKNGTDISITDGFWTIVIGDTGLFGLVSFTAFHWLPQFLLYRRYPVRLWRDPAVAPAAALSLGLGLYLIDNLFNATFGPVTTLICGGLMGLTPRALSRAGASGAGIGSGAEGVPELAARLVGSEQIAEAERVCRQAAVFYEARAAGTAGGSTALWDQAAARNSLGAVLIASGRYREAEEALEGAASLMERLVSEVPAEPLYRQGLAGSLVNLGNAYHATGRPEDAMNLWRHSLEIGGALAAEYPSEVNYRRELAAGLDHLARVLQEQGQPLESEEVRGAAVAWWAGLAGDHPEDPEYRTRWADGCNDLAWSRSSEGASDPRDAEAAVRFALDATSLFPECSTYWNTLGVAYYRAGAWESAASALERASGLNRGGNGFDLYFLAMAYTRQGRHESALRCRQLADSWAGAHPSSHADLIGIRAEAEGVLAAHGPGHPDAKALDGEVAPGFGGPAPHATRDATASPPEPSR